MLRFRQRQPLGEVRVRAKRWREIVLEAEGGGTRRDHYGVDADTLHGVGPGRRDAGDMPGVGSAVETGVGCFLHGAILPRVLPRAGPSAGRRQRSVAYRPDILLWYTYAVFTRAKGGAMGAYAYARPTTVEGGDFRPRVGRTGRRANAAAGGRNGCARADAFGRPGSAYAGRCSSTSPRPTGSISVPTKCSSGRQSHRAS